MIYLNERLAITADKYQYILGTPNKRVLRSGSDPEITLDNPVYCRTLAQALRVAISREMKRGVEIDELQTLQIFADHLEKIIADFETKIAFLDV